MSSFCGLDFGTSNSAIGIELAGKSQLVAFNNQKNTMRSAIFCDAEQKRFIFGQEGMDLYLSGNPGRLMMSLKSVLGTALMTDKTLIFNDFISFKNILGYFLSYLKKHAEAQNGQPLTQVVLGRPVHFHDTNLKQDQAAEATLQEIAVEVGFKDVSFQYEPIAAALTYETQIEKEQLALIVDMGGGTSDFTIIRLSPHQQMAQTRRQDVLANTGIHIAGTNFDQDLSLQAVMPLLGLGGKMTGSSSDIQVPKAFYYDLTAWHTLNQLYTAKNIASVRSYISVAHDKQLLKRLLSVLQNKSGHHILAEVENSKHTLSDALDCMIQLGFIEDDLQVRVTQAEFNHMIASHTQQIMQTIAETVSLAGIQHADLNAIFYTGGSTKIPLIRQQINALFPNANIVQGNIFESVGLGLTLEAKRRYG